MILNIDPVLLSLGPIKIRYYGFIYMTGFLVAYFALSFFVKNKYIKSSLVKEDVENFIFYVVFWTVCGARLFEVLFYSGAYFIAHPLKVFAVWEGGLSFHGGLLGVMVYSIYFAKKHKVKPLVWLDYCAIPASFALFLGRIANFINGELYGLPVANQSNPPWYGVKFVRTDPEGLYRIPVQLWESFGNLLTFFILIFALRILKKKYHCLTEGVLGFAFLFFYGFFRFVVEYWKDYERNIFLGLTTGQLLCIPLIIAGFAGVLFSLSRIKKEIKIL